MSAFIRYCSWRETHPMSGGVLRAKRDHVNEYIELRKRAFGVELAPLPKSLTLPCIDRKVEPPLGLAERDNSNALSTI